MSIARDFADFHRDYPAVLAELRAHALQLAQKQEGIISLKRVYEALRVCRCLDNNFTSRYARLILATTPELRGRLKTRRLRA